MSRVCSNFLKYCILETYLIPKMRGDALRNEPGKAEQMVRPFRESALSSSGRV